MPIGSHWTQAETVDSAPRVSPEDVEAQQFDTVLRGYDPSAVVNFLRDVARSYRTALSEADQARDALESHVCPEPGAPVTVEVVREVQVPAPAPAADQYAAMSADVAAVLRAAYASATEVREKAKHDAEAQIDAATRQLEELNQALAERQASVEAELTALRQRSEREAEGVIERARAEADRVDRELVDRRARVAEQEAELRSRLESAATMLDQLLHDVPSMASALSGGDGTDSADAG